MLIRIQAPHFCAGMEISDSGRRVAPIISYMRPWTVGQIYQYCRAKGWEASAIRCEWMNTGNQSKAE